MIIKLTVIRNENPILVNTNTIEYIERTIDPTNFHDEVECTGIRFMSGEMKYVHETPEEIAKLVMPQAKVDFNAFAAPICLLKGETNE